MEQKKREMGWKKDQEKPPGAATAYLLGRTSLSEPRG
jgi:hypothetical protein